MGSYLKAGSLFPSMFSRFTPRDQFYSIQNNEWKSPIELLSVERVNKKYKCIIFFSALVPDEVKKELLQRIRAFLAQQALV